MKCLLCNRWMKCHATEEISVMQSSEIALFHLLQSSHFIYCIASNFFIFSLIVSLIFYFFIKARPGSIEAGETGRPDGSGRTGQDRQMSLIR